GDPEEFASACTDLLPADIAEALNDLPVDAAARVVAAVPFGIAVQVLDEPSLESRDGIVSLLPDDVAIPLIQAMSADQQVRLFRDLKESDRARLLHVLDAPTRDQLKRLMSYPPQSAGGLMTTEFVSVPAEWTALQVRLHVAREGSEKETVYAIYVLDGRQRLERVVSLREVVIATSDQVVETIGDGRKPVTVSPLVDREDVARLISKYNLLAIPVVDDGGHILGIVTVDDVIDAMISEQTEDVQKMGGMAAMEESYMETSLPTMIRKRAGWLSALFLGEMLTATAMGHFEQEINRAVVLALFIPLIISSGGNSGGQATSLIIRALALKEVSLGDWWRVAVREVPAGLALGLILGTLGFIRIVLWQSLGWYDYGEYHTLVALTVALSLVGVVLFGSLAGSMLPFLLRRLGFDPASASAPFVATLVDVTGLVIYFSVGYLVLRGTLL
ncbi:MAG: magnesium transporter, partial [Gemmatimonadota bacterium]|nr:magnesium transporter [Gemmatimonadota bacterium]